MDVDLRGKSQQIVVKSQKREENSQRLSRAHSFVPVFEKMNKSRQIKLCGVAMN